MDMHTHHQFGTVRQLSVDALITQLHGLSNTPNHERLATIEDLFEEAGGKFPGTTSYLFGSHHGPAQIEIDADTINRQCAEMARIAGYHKTESRQSALAAIRCTLERMIVALRHIAYPGLTNMLPNLATAA